MLLEEDREFDIFVGSRIGSFKHIKYHTDTSKNSKKRIENLVDIKTLQKDDCITCLEWGNSEQTEILLGKRNQKIQVYNPVEDTSTDHIADFAPGEVVGLGRYKRKLLAAVSSGVVKIWSKKMEEIVNVGGKIDRMRVCAEDSTLFATGGEENDLKVWKIGEPAPLFIAKNLPHDWLQLRRPVWVTDLTFLPGEGGNLVSVCSRHGYVRLYDTRAQRRPVCCVDFENMAATCIAPSFDERQVLVGFGRGHLHQVDLRKGKPDKGFKGSVGAVTDIAAVRDGRLVVSCSLDRQLRVHRYETKELVYKQYLTSKLSRLLIQTESSTPLKNAESEIKEEEGAQETEVQDEYDALFEKMETIGEKSRKKLIQEEKQSDILSEDTPAKKIKPSTEGSTADLDEDSKEDAIKKLLRSTEKQKKKREQKKSEKKAKSVFHNA